MLCVYKFAFKSLKSFLGFSHSVLCDNVFTLMFEVYLWYIDMFLRVLFPDKDAFRWTSKGLQQGRSWSLRPSHLLREEGRPPGHGEAAGCSQLALKTQHDPHRHGPGSVQSILEVSQSDFLILVPDIEIFASRWNHKYCLPKYCGITPFVQVNRILKLNLIIAILLFFFIDVCWILSSILSDELQQH